MRRLIGWHYRYASRIFRARFPDATNRHNSRVQRQKGRSFPEKSGAKGKVEEMTREKVKESSFERANTGEEIGNVEAKSKFSSQKIARRYKLKVENKHAMK